MTDAPSPDTPETWGAASRGYAEKVAPLLMESFATEFVERLGADENHQALEVAAGSGALTSTLAGRVKSLLATDFAPKMIEVLRERMSRAGRTNIEYAVMDGQNLHVEDASFDRVASSFAVMLFPDRVRGFAEMRRVLRPGGRALVSGWAGPEKFGAFEIFLAGMKRALPDMPPPPPTPPVFRLADLAAFKSEMEQGGFVDVEVDYVTRELELDGFEKTWAMMTVGAPPVQMLFDRVGEDGKNRIRDSIQQLVRERFSDGPVKFSNSATVGIGTAPMN